MEELIETASPWLECGLAWIAFPGELLPGDRPLVHSDNERALIGVIDGAGHGAAAAEAAAEVARLVERHWKEPLEELFTACHEELSGSRGAALTLVSLDSVNRTLSWMGVGDVMACLSRSGQPRKVLVPTPGVLGYRIPREFRLQTLPLAPEDLIGLATDGVAADFSEDIDGSSREPVRTLAGRVLAKHRTGKDDALLLIARYRGEGP